MFGLKNILKHTSNASVKVTASNSFINSIKNLHDSKDSTVKEHRDKKYDLSLMHLEIAKDLLEGCKKTNNFSKDKLKMVSDNLLKSIEYNHKNPEVYLNLAYVFHLQGNNNSAIKNINIAQDINPNFAGIEKFKQLIKLNKKISKK